MFDISYFKKRPQAFYTLADELFPSKFQPTPFHLFMRLVEQKGCLRRVFTQNIDTLERLAGIAPDKVVEAHGSFATNRCVDCKAPMSAAELQRQMYPGGGTSVDASGRVGIPRCLRAQCGGLVKPDIVFFGEGLPERFFELWGDDLPDADLAIVAGTSLTVSPFAQLPDDVGCPRMLFNMEPAGTLGRRAEDVLVLGECDAGAELLAKLCGWEAEWGALKQRAAAGSATALQEQAEKEKAEVRDDSSTESGSEEQDETESKDEEEAQEELAEDLQNDDKLAEELAEELSAKLNL